jgi:hypothetical protein
MIKDIIIFSVAVMGTIWIASVLFIYIAEKVSNHINNLKK